MHRRQRRRHIEALPPEVYDKTAYYEKWVLSLGESLIKRGVITTRSSRARWSKLVNESKFNRRERVKVLRAYPLGHVRTPFYIRGLPARSAPLCGAFPNPE